MVEAEGFCGAAQTEDSLVVAFRHASGDLMVRVWERECACPLHHRGSIVSLAVSTTSAAHSVSAASRCATCTQSGASSSTSSKPSA